MIKRRRILSIFVFVLSMGLAALSLPFLTHGDDGLHPMLAFLMVTVLLSFFLGLLVTLISSLIPRKNK